MVANYAAKDIWVLLIGMLFIGNNGKIPNITRYPCKKKKHRFCQEWLFLGLKPVVHISAQVFLEQSERMCFCCCTSRIRVAAWNSHQIIPYSLPPRLPNTCSLRTSNKNALVAKLPYCPQSSNKHSRSI